MTQMFGKAKVSADGKELLVDDGSKINLGGVRRHTVKGPRVYGFAEEVMEATCDVNVYIDADTDLDELNGMDDVTILFQADTGQKYVMAHAWLTEPVDAAAKTTGGQTPLKFASVEAQQI